MYPASDLAARGAPIGKEELFVQLSRRMAVEIERWDRGRGFAAIRAAWLVRATGVGAPIRVNLRDRVLEGRFEALDETGRLVLARAGGGIETVAAGDVFFGGRG
jgi:BirA family biotin operon repressor/biotin-[acetyl-CoA-carboxylase] ligase